MSYAAGIDNNQIGLFFRRFDLVESEPFEQLPNLLAFILIDFAAKGIYGKSFHDCGKSSHNMV